jgi:pyrimidine operon attenuation protein / uracil phosphoribosyltransferase
MEPGRILMDAARMGLTIERMCLQLLEMPSDEVPLCVVGIQPRGIRLAKRISDQIALIEPTMAFEYGELDITFYRDDVRRSGYALQAQPTRMDFLVEGKRVVLVDDVLYTGRTIQAALAALQPFGRPARVELVTLIDRRFNRELPIQAHVVGLRVDALDEAYVRVEWEHIHGQDRVLLFAAKPV